MPRTIIIYNFQVKPFNKSLLNMPSAIIRNINFQVKSQRCDFHICINSNGLWLLNIPSVAFRKQKKKKGKIIF